MLIRYSYGVRLSFRDVLGPTGGVSKAKETKSPYQDLTPDKRMSASESSALHAIVMEQVLPFSSFSRYVKAGAGI
jgi:hypothetical protein